METTEMRNRAAERAAEDGEVASRAMGRMGCHACGAGDGMQAYIMHVTLTLPRDKQVGYYYRENDPEPDTLYKPCRVCGRAYEVGIRPNYKEWRP